MNRYLRIAARVAAQEPVETPIQANEVDELVSMLKRQFDLISQAAQRDNPQRAIKLLEGAYIALETVLNLLTQGHEEVEEKRELVEDKIEQVTKNLRPIRLQIH